MKIKKSEISKNESGQYLLTCLQPVYMEIDFSSMTEYSNFVEISSMQI